MRVLFLCGVFAKENEEEIIAAAKRPVEYSANVFQEKLIEGFSSCDCELSVISAPFIGSYPNASSIRNFRGFKSEQNKYTYVNFKNAWGIRNISRSNALKRAVRAFALDEGENDKMIAVYSPHTPFLEAAVYAKRLDPTIKICLIVPDLPQYMNLDAKISVMYKLAKKIDIKRFNRFARYVDAYMLLTEHMKDRLKVGNKPYAIIEGIVNSGINLDVIQSEAELDKLKYVVYTGKINEKFGVKNLIDAFSTIKDENYRLVLCGRGDAEEYAKSKSREDGRIMCLGQVTPDVARDWVNRAAVLVNPRQNNEEYTKYSFPSKNIEYLASGRPVVAYMLDGMSSIYESFIYAVSDNSIEALADAIKSAASSDEEECVERNRKTTE